MFGAKKKPPAPSLTRAQALGGTPVKNVHVRETRLESGEVVVHFPVAVRPWVARVAGWMGRSGALQRTGRLQLDLLGTGVWDMLDGRRSLGRICAAFAQEHQLDPREAEIAVTQFVRELGRRGLVGLR